MITCVLGGQSTLFLEGLRAALSREPRITVGESATDPSGMVRMVRASSPDVVVLTYEPPRLSIEVAQAVRPVPALMLTWSPRVQDAAAALRAGVQGFLVKDAPERQIHAAVRAVGTGCLSYPREYGDILSLVGASGTGSPPALTLTEREQAIVELVAEGLTSQQIATRLGIAPQTVKNHVNNAMHKVGVNSRLQLAAWAGQRLPTTTHGPGARSLGRPSGAPGGVNAARGVASRQEL
ncbi:MAG TPA: response regulator transcription factor [Jiangellales bacterium]|nr:response regulator transcription factor [Jiangellales bacterium]